jgi:hypothetical protein
MRTANSRAGNGTHAVDPRTPDACGAPSLPLFVLASRRALRTVSCKHSSHPGLPLAQGGAA